jgi:hypothetical protein
MTLPFILLGLVAAALVALVAIDACREADPKSDRNDPDALYEAWFEQLGVENGAEEAVDRRLRMVDLMRRRVARIGRRPRP